MKMQHSFVEFMPDKIQEGVVYISPEFCSVIHLCACGCGEEVNTPLSPTGWKLIYDGKNITLDPSIGNWSFKCRSHYWIRNSEVIWAENWSDTQVNKKREYDRDQTEKYFEKFKFESKKYSGSDISNTSLPKKVNKSFWKKIIDFFRGK